MQTSQMQLLQRGEGQLTHTGSLLRRRQIYKQKQLVHDAGNAHTAMLKAEAAGQRFLLVPTFFALSAKSAQLCATERVAKHKES